MNGQIRTSYSQAPMTAHEGRMPGVGLPAMLRNRNGLMIAGALSLAISVLAWISDLTGMVYACPYCRVERTSIGLLGLVILALPWLNRFFARYLSVAVGAFGFIVAVMQNFTYGWLLMFQGTFKIHDPWTVDPMLLSGAALVIIAFQIGIIFEAR
ncbi:TPA: hypothetical protein ACKQBZ_000108 [Stenotrophomonas maltophilia]|uniref:Uncharacterized protein n=1 Tax=Stenotrophomonas maltophilia TaxID=40324 RepID=A0AAJ2MSV2_STEMA|nr:hypothetical protein [Stenotrophomonas maltophilia]MDT3468328.1 hypothetical protein [Stenotrophomonas maltophilia]